MHFTTLTILLAFLSLAAAQSSNSVVLGPCTVGATCDLIPAASTTASAAAPTGSPILTRTTNSTATRATNGTTSVAAVPTRDPLPSISYVDPLSMTMTFGAGATHLSSGVERVGGMGWAAVVAAAGGVVVGLW